MTFELTCTATYWCSQVEATMSRLFIILIGYICFLFVSSFLFIFCLFVCFCVVLSINDTFVFPFTGYIPFFPFVVVVVVFVLFCCFGLLLLLLFCFVLSFSVI